LAVSVRRIIAVGGGIIGLPAVLKLFRRFPDAQIVVLEKESGDARHQSGNFSLSSTTTFSEIKNFDFAEPVRAIKPLLTR
jgi:glycine/D-amino acid oxidase-like deaminating enzyme